MEFIYIGPDKSGSTWLYNQLLRHPDIFVPAAKDLYFFDKNYDKGIEWYEKFFSHKNEKVVGEISHDYIFSSESIKRIHDCYPNVKLITILRNPLDKIWSHYLFLQRSGITRKKFDDALLDHKELIEKAQYSKGLEQALILFKREQIGVFYFEQLLDNPQSLLDQILKFLDVKQLVGNQVNVNPLPASSPRNYYIAKFAKYLAKSMRSLGLQNVLGILKRNQYIKKILYKEIHNKSSMDSSMREHLLCNYFIQDITNIEHLLNVDLSEWKN